jgi:aldose 1-epimerase
LSPITLRQGAAQASLLPHLGGAVGSFTVEGHAVLRPTPEHATDPLETACFPLVPYPNRIAAGRFTFAGKAYAIPPNHPAFPHPLHGLGWLKPWAVTAQTQNTAALTCSHKADENWPWDWSATQRFELSEHALRITLELVNGAEQAMPAGLGLHPYFVRRAGDALRFAAAGVWHNDEAMLPVRPGAADALGDFKHGAMPSERRGRHRDRDRLKLPARLRAAGRGLRLPRTHEPDARRAQPSGFSEGRRHRPHPGRVAGA